MTPARIIENGIQTGVIQPGQMQEFTTMKGVIQVIGTTSGFAIRLPDVRTGPDIAYNADDEVSSLTIQNPDNSTLKLDAAAVVDFQESPEFDG